MQKGKVQLAAAVVIGVMACPMLCGASFGMMGIEPPIDGPIDQPALRMSLGIFFGISAVLALALAIKAVCLIRPRGSALAALTVVRLSALFPLAAGLVIVMATDMQARDAWAGEGISFMTLGLVLMSTGIAMICTRRSAFEPD